MPVSSNSSLFPWVGGMILGSAATASLMYGLFLAKNRGDQSSSFLARTNNKKKTIASTYQATHGEQLSGTFLTDLLAALWKHIAEAGAMKLRNTLEPMFPDMLPGPLRSLHFTKVSLGDVPLRLDNIVVHDRQTHNDGVEFVEYEMDVVWDGRMDVQLRADYIGAFGVRSVKLRGRLSIVLQPLTGQALPCFTCASYAFISRPELDMDFTGLAQAADFSGLRAAIRDMMLDVLAGMMVLPNRQLYKMDDTVSYLDTHVPPLGVARLTLWRGRGFRVEKRNLMRGDDVPDCYCNIQLSNAAVWKTSVVKDSVAPVWGQDEQCDFLLFHHDQVVQVQAWDEDTGLGDADDSLGRAEVSVGELLLAPGGSKEVELLEPNGKATGAFVTLQCAVQPLVTDLTTTSLLDRPIAAAGTTSCTTVSKNDKLMLGLLTILVSQAFDVPIRDAKSSYFVHIQCGATAEFVTAAVAGESHPLYECTFRLPITASMLRTAAGSGNIDDDSFLPPLRFALVEGTMVDSKTNHCLGTFEVPCSVLRDSPDATVTGRGKFGDAKEAASLEYSVSLRGVPSSSNSSSRTGVMASVADALPAALSGGSSSPTKTTEVESMVRITAVKGWGFQEEKRGMLRRSDIPDVYCKVKFGSSPTVWRTSTVKDSVSPEWNESQTYPMRKHGQALQIEVFDEDKGQHDTDDYLGSARISIGKLLLAGGSCDIELMMEGKPTGSFVEFGCELVAPSSD